MTEYQTKRDEERANTCPQWEAYVDKSEGWANWSKDEVEEHLDSWAEENSVWNQRDEIERHYKNALREKKLTLKKAKK